VRIIPTTASKPRVRRTSGAEGCTRHTLLNAPVVWHNNCHSQVRISRSVAGFAQFVSKDDLIDMQGTVVAVHSGGLYRVQCDAGHEVLAQLSGRMRRFRIKVVPGDRVTVGISPYDPVRGIITFRAR
jgi:translation initiation factor IF-1